MFDKILKSIAETYINMKKEQQESAAPPFDGPYKKVPNKTVTDKSGAKHTPMSQVKDLTKRTLAKSQQPRMSMSDLAIDIEDLLRDKLTVAQIVKKLKVPKEWVVAVQGWMSEGYISQPDGGHAVGINHLLEAWVSEGNFTDHQPLSEELKVGDKVSFKREMAAARGNYMSYTGIIVGIKDDHAAVKVKSKSGVMSYAMPVSSLTKEEFVREIDEVLDTPERQNKYLNKAMKSSNKLSDKLDKLDAIWPGHSSIERIERKIKNRNAGIKKVFRKGGISTESVEEAEDSLEEGFAIQGARAGRGRVNPGWANITRRAGKISSIDLTRGQPKTVFGDEESAQTLRKEILSHLKTVPDHGWFSFTVEKVRGKSAADKTANEEVSLDESADRFSDQQIEKLRKEYGSIQRIDPENKTTIFPPAYKKLIKYLDGLTPEHLKQLAAANIKFVSSLATNRVSRLTKEEVSLDESADKFSDQQIEKLRKEYGSIQGIDPDQPSYKKLIKYLDGLTPEHLKQLAAANIKFVSGLARNRVSRLTKEEVDLNELSTYNLGDKVHIGHATKGGAGYRGKFLKIDGNTVHIDISNGTEKFGPRIVTGHVKNLTKEETELEEGGMPGSVIRSKQKYAAMSDQEFANLHGHKTEEQLRQMAWTHGYGKMNPHYWNRVQKAKAALKEETELEEASVSQNQQKFMGMVYATKKGKIESPSKEVAKAADSMTMKSAKDFASTKHEGLPKRVADLEEETESYVESYGRKPNNSAQKAKWMSDFEDHVTSQDSKHAGKIDWNSATHFHNTGKDAKDAADLYVKNRLSEELSRGASIVKEIFNKAKKDKANKKTKKDEFVTQPEMQHGIIQSVK